MSTGGVRVIGAGLRTVPIFWRGISVLWLRTPVSMHFLARDRTLHVVMGRTLLMRDRTILSMTIRSSA